MMKFCLSENMLLQTKKIMEFIKKYIADFLTILRIVCSASMLFFKAFSVWFYALYIFCGISDMCDGAVARKTNSESSFGAMLDTVADFVFVVVAMIKILPELYINKWMCMVILFVAIVKLFTFWYTIFCRKTPEKLHSLMNKITGFVLFILPLTIKFVNPVYSVPVVCVAVMISVFCEGYALHHR